MEKYIIENQDSFNLKVLDGIKKAMKVILVL